MKPADERNCLRLKYDMPCMQIEFFLPKESRESLVNWSFLVLLMLIFMIAMSISNRALKITIWKKKWLLISLKL